MENINNDNIVINMNNYNLAIKKFKNLKRFNSDVISINKTYDIEARINRILQKINNVYKLFFESIFCRSITKKASFNTYKISRNILENKMDVVNYLRLIEKEK